MVKTLEQIENDFLPAHEQSLPDDETSELPDTTVGKTSSNSEPVSEAETPSAQSKPKHLTQKFIEIRANQSNVSYKRLFGDYLETASHIIITCSSRQMGITLSNASSQAHPIALLNARIWQSPYLSSTSFLFG